MYLPEMLLVSASWVCFWLKMEPGEKVDIPEHLFINPVSNRLINILQQKKCGCNTWTSKMQLVQVMMLKN